MDAPPPIDVQLRKKTTLAKLALAFSCCGLITPLFIGSFVGIVCGHMALAEFRRQPALHGRTLAVWGLVVGYLTITIGFIGEEVVLLCMGH